MFGIRGVLNQFIAHKITTFFVILGLSISIILASLGISTIKKSNEIVQQQINYALQNTIEFEIKFEGQENLNDVFKIFQGIDNNTGVILDDVYLSNTGGLIPVTPEYWNSRPIERIPLVEGRYLNKGDIDGGRKVALVGKNKDKDLIKRDGESYIELGLEQYKVVGIIGVMKKNTKVLDSQVIIPATALPNSLLEKILSQRRVKYTIYNQDKDTFNDEKMIKNNVKRYFKGALCTAMSTGIDIGTAYNTRLGDEFYLAIFIYILAIINAINMTSYWINDRRYEIGIRKAFGYNNFDITLMLFIEMAVISIIAVLVGFFMQVLLSNLLEKLINYPVVISTINLLIAILFVLISAGLATIIPAIKAMKIQPVEAINL